MHQLLRQLRARRLRLLRWSSLPLLLLLLPPLPSASLSFSFPFVWKECEGREEEG